MVKIKAANFLFLLATLSGCTTVSETQPPLSAQPAPALNPKLVDLERMVAAGEEKHAAQKRWLQSMVEEEKNYTNFLLKRQNDLQTTQAFLAARRKEFAQARQDRIEAEKRISQLEEKNSVLIQSLSETLKNEAHLGQRIEGDTLTIRMDEVFFKKNSALPTLKTRPVLHNVATFMLNNQHYDAFIFGYADPYGKPDYNLALSRKRAEAIAAALEKQGVELSRLHPQGCGEEYSPKNQQLKRRVEIVLVPKDTDFIAKCQH